MAVETSIPRTRRSLLAGALGGLAAWAATAVGRPPRAQAATGDYLVIGEPNRAGRAQTSLISDALGASFIVQTANESTGATGVFGWASSAGPNRTRGVYGRSDSDVGYGVEASNTAGIQGSGAAVRAMGGQNHGLDAITAHGDSFAVRGVNSAAHAGTGISGRGARIGVEGVAHLVGGAAVHGRGNPGGAVGVLGQGSVGVRGESLLDGGSGVMGIASGIRGRSIGVYGVSSDPTGYGVRAQSAAREGGTGIYAEAFGPTGVAGYFMGRVFATLSYELQESPDLGAPDANQARLFARDSGGKTQLCVRFPTGAVQVIATEP
jgi:hypothetical protein